MATIQDVYSVACNAGYINADEFSEQAFADMLKDKNHRRAYYEHVKRSDPDFYSRDYDTFSANVDGLLGGGTLRQKSRTPLSDGGTRPRVADYPAPTNETEYEANKINQNWGEDVLPSGGQGGSERPLLDGYSEDALRLRRQQILDEAERERQRRLLEIEQYRTDARKEWEEHPVRSFFKGLNSPEQNAYYSKKAISETDAKEYAGDKEQLQAIEDELGRRAGGSVIPQAQESTKQSEALTALVRQEQDLSTHQRANLGAAEYLNTKANEILNAGSKFDDSNAVANWWEGLKNDLFDRDISGVMGFQREARIGGIVTKLNNEEELTNDEQALLNAYFNLAMATEARQFDLSTGYQIGQGTAQSVPFMIDMVVSRGMGAAAKRGLLKALAKTGFKDVARVEKWLQMAETGGKTTARDIARQASYEGVATPVQTLLMPSSWAQMQEEGTQKRLESGENSISFLDRTRIFTNATKETLTERLGGDVIDWGLGKAVGKMTQPWRLGGKGQFAVNKYIQSPIGETGEEYIGALIDLVRSYNPLYDEESNQQLREGAKEMFTAEGLGKTFGTVLPMSLVGGAVNMGELRVRTREMDKARDEIIRQLTSFCGASEEEAQQIMAYTEGASTAKEFAERLDIVGTHLYNAYENMGYDMEKRNKDGEREGMGVALRQSLNDYAEQAAKMNGIVEQFSDRYDKLSDEEKAQAKQALEQVQEQNTQRNMLILAGNRASEEVGQIVNRGNNYLYNVAFADGSLQEGDEAFVVGGNVAVSHRENGEPVFDREASESNVVEVRINHADGTSEVRQVALGELNLLQEPMTAAEWLNERKNSLYREMTAGEERQEQPEAAAHATDAKPKPATVRIADRGTDRQGEPTVMLSEPIEVGGIATALLPEKDMDGILRSAGYTPTEDGAWVREEAEQAADVTERTEEEVEQQAEEEIQPVGNDPQWGNVYQWATGKVKEAVDFLRKHRSGYLKGVFHRDEIGDIDLGWGNEKKGLRHIIQRHIAEQNDFNSVDEAVEAIKRTIANGTLTKEDEKYVINDGTHRVVIAEDTKGNWVITAYDYIRSIEEKKRKNNPSATLLTAGQTSEEAGTRAVIPESHSSETVAATPLVVPSTERASSSDMAFSYQESSGTISEGKGSENNPNTQEVVQKNVPFAANLAAAPRDEQGRVDYTKIENSDELARVVTAQMRGDKDVAKRFVEAKKKAAKDALKNTKHRTEDLNDPDKFLAVEEKMASLQKEVSRWDNALTALRTIRTEEEQAAYDAEQARQQAEREARKQTEAGAVGKTMAERYAAAPKIDGNAGTITTANGQVLRGHYVLVSADGLTPSHDARNGFAMSDGYPTVDGQSINDRDYKNDPEEQAKVQQIAQQYNGNAIKNMPIVSDEGLVYNGNGRTMAGQLAASQGTDGAYRQAITDNAAQFGFTAAQVASVPNARVVFQTDERLPYNTTTLAMFNATEQQAQSNTAKAAANTRKLTPEAIGHIIRAVSGFDNTDAFFNDKKAPFDLIDRLIEDKVLTDRDKAALIDGNRLSGAGKDMLTAMLFGTAFDEQTIRLLADNAQVQNSVMRALPQILENKGLGEYSLFEHINNAIAAIYDMRAKGMSFYEFAKQVDIFGQTAGDKYTAFELLLADEMMNGGVSAFRDVLTLYNERARQVAGGQTDLLGETTTYEQIANEIVEHYKNKDNEQQAQQSSRQGNAATQPVAAITQGSEGTWQADAPNAHTTYQEQLDSQGNPIDTNGDLIVEEVESVYDITDEDFDSPSRNVALPAIPNNIASALGINERPVIIKKNIFEKNRDTHEELSPEDSRAILINALYNTNLYGQSKPVSRPSYRVAIQIGDDKNSVVVIDVYQNKDKVEIVGWRYINEKGLERLKKQVKREDGHLLILSPSSGLAAALSALPSNDVSSLNGKSAHIRKATLPPASDTAIQGDQLTTPVGDKEIYNRHTTAKQSTETAEASRAGEQSGTQQTPSMNAPISEIPAGKGTKKSSTDQIKSQKNAENLQNASENGEKTGGERHTAADLRHERERIIRQETGKDDASAYEESVELVDFNEESDLYMEAETILNELMGGKGDVMSVEYEKWYKAHSDKGYGIPSLRSIIDEIERQQETRETERINEQFNRELQQQIEGTLPKGHIYQLGMPSGILLACGFPDMPIELSSTNLAEHAKKTHHPFELGDARGIVEALQHPIAVFAYGDQTKSQNVIVEIQKDGRNFLVGVHFNQTRNETEVSSIRGIFPKDNAEWLNWITQGKALYLDKEKIQTLIDQQRKNLADVEYLDLNSVAKVVKNFDNPKLSEEKSEKSSKKKPQQDLTTIEKEIKELVYKQSQVLDRDRAISDEYLQISKEINEILFALTEDQIVELHKNWESKISIPDELSNAYKEVLNQRILWKKYDEARRIYPTEATPASKAKPAKIKITDWVEKDKKKGEIRPILEGVYHDPKGFAVATNAHILIVSKKDFDKTKAGKVIDAKGNEIDGKFPRYKNIINTPISENVKVDIDRMRNFVAGIPKSKQSITDVVILRLPNGQLVSFIPHNLAKILDAAKSWGVSTLDFSRSMRNVVMVKAGDGSVALSTTIPIEGDMYKDTYTYHPYDLSQGYTLPSDIDSSNEDGGVRLLVGGTEQSAMTEDQQTAYDVVREMLEEAGVPVEVLTDEAMTRLAETAGVRTDAHAESVEEADRRFNEEIERYRRGEMKTNEYLSAGNPSGVLRMFMPDLPVIIRQHVLSKASVSKHNVDVSALKNLPSHLSRPIFVFQRNDNTLGILTEIKDRDGKNVCVAIELGKTIQSGKDYLEVNDVRSIHGRDIENIILPIVHNNTLRYVDKEQGLVWLSSASSNYQQEIDKKDLDSAAKVVKKFETPKFSEEKNEKDAEKHGAQILKESTGVVYGAAVGGKIYLNGSHLNPNTPMHEYTHLWDDMVRRENPALWERGKELLKQLPLWDEVRNDPNYANIRDNEDEVASEVHSRLSGEDGAKLLDEMVERAKREGTKSDVAKSVSLKNRIKDWLQEMWADIKGTFEKWSNKDLSDLSVEQFARMPLRDLAEGISPKNGSKKQTAAKNAAQRYAAQYAEPFDMTQSGKVRQTVLAEIRREREEIERKAKADGTWMKAPNGNPTNLTQEQWITVRTKRFKNWFGDWNAKHEAYIEMPNRLAQWLSKENIEKAKGKSRDEILKEFGNKPQPIAFIPVKFLQYVDKNLTDNRVYSGMGYFIDHAVNHHPNIPAEKYQHIQDVLNNPDEVKAIVDNGNNSIVFIKQIDRYNAVVIEVEKTDDGRIIWHKSFYDQKKKPYAHKGTRLYESSSEGGVSPIIRTDESAHDSSLSVLDDGAKVQQKKETTKSFGNFLRPDADFSQIVDENGEPMVVYHGTRADFTIFDSNKNNPTLDGFYFTDREELAKKFAGYKGHVGSYFLNVRNPERNGFDGSGANMKKSEYRDGGIFIKRQTDRYAEKGTKEIIVFSPNQIKSATDNAGTFSTENDDIRFSIIGEKGASGIDKSEEVSTRIDNLRVARQMEHEGKGERAIRISDNLTEAQQLALDAVMAALDNAGVEVDVVSEEIAREEIEKQQSDGNVRLMLQMTEQGTKGLSYYPIAGAKLQKNLQTTKENYKKLANSTKNAVSDIAKALGARNTGTSNYITIEAKNGKVFTLRISNHNATVSNFDNNGEQDGISIVISRHDNNGITNNGNAHVVEFFYSDKALNKAEGTPIADIIGALEQTLYSGEYTDPTGLAERQEVNIPATLLQTQDGTVYGYAKDGKIHLTHKGLNPNTPIHEYAHLWAKAMQRNNPQGWQSAVERLKGTPMWDAVVNDPHYQSLADENAIASEVLARYSGKRGAERMETMAKELLAQSETRGEVAKVVSLIQRAKKALQNFWKWVGENLFDIKRFSSAEEVADRVLYDLMNGTDIKQQSDSSVRLMLQIMEQGTKGQSNYPIAGAKLQKNLETTKEKYKNIGISTENAITDIAKTLGARNTGTSNYVTIEAKNGKIFTLRISNHNATVSNFDNNGEDNGISIVISRHDNNGITNNGNAHVVEFFYSDKALNKAEGTPIADIIGALEQTMYSGEYKDPTGLAQVQEVNIPADTQTEYSRIQPNETLGEYAHRIAEARRKEQDGERAEFSMSDAPTPDPDETRIDYVARFNMWYNEQRKEEAERDYVQAMQEARRKTERALQVVADRYRPLQKFQEYILSQGGTIRRSEQDADGNLIRTSADAYQDTTLATGRAGYQIQRFASHQLKDMVNAVAAIINSHRLDDIDIRWNNVDTYFTDKKNAKNGTRLTARELVGIYAQAKDCQEAIEQELPDRGKDGFLRNLQDVNGNPVSHTEVIRLVEGALEQEQIDNLWQSINAATQFSLDYQLRNGMIDQATYDQFHRNYYVPERGWRERDLDGREDGYTEGRGTQLNGNPYNAALKKARGRDSIASDPFAYIQSIAETTILSTERNNVKQKFLQMLLDNEEIGMKSGAWKIRRAYVVRVTDSNGEAHEVVTYERPKDESTIVTSVVPETMIAQRTRDERLQHRVAVMRNGQQYIIELQDEALANALNSNFKEAQWLSNSFANVMRKGVRYMSAINTQYNPAFAIWNLARDLQIGIVNNAAKESGAFQARFLKNIAAVQPVIMQYVWNDHMKGDENFGKNEELSRYLQEYFESGAQTGFSYMQDVQTLSKEFDKLVKGDSKAKRALEATTDFMSMATELSELTVRFAEFATARQMGFTTEEAAAKAKEISVNFDRKGLLGGTFSGLYSFFNATIQGTWNILRGLKTKRAWIAYLSIAGVYATLGFINTLLNPDDPDDDIFFSDYERQTNFLIGKIKLPVTHFFRMFFAAGVNITLMGQGKKTGKQTAYDIVNFVLDEIVPASALQLHNLADYNETTNEIEFAPEKYAQAITPSYISPLTDVALNRDFKGATVHREPFITADKDKYKRVSMEKRNTPEIYHDIAYGLNRLFGGNPDIKTKGGSTDGLLDINANDLQHIFEGYAGGTGKFVGDLVSLAIGAAQGEFDVSNVPVVNRAFRPYQQERAYTQQYWLLKNRVDHYNALLKDTRENDPEEYRKMTNSDLYDAYLDAQKIVGGKRNKPTDDGTYTADQVKELMKLNVQWNKAQ